MYARRELLNLVTRIMRDPFISGFMINAPGPGATLDRGDAASVEKKYRLRVCCCYCGLPSNLLIATLVVVVRRAAQLGGQGFLILYSELRRQW